MSVPTPSAADRERAFDALQQQRLSVEHNAKWLAALIAAVRDETLERAAQWVEAQSAINSIPFAEGIRALRDAGQP